MNVKELAHRSRGDGRGIWRNKMTKLFTKFCTEEDGAVTVDWVVLTAAIVGLGVAVVGTIHSSAMDNANGLGAHLGSMSIQTF